MTLRERLDAAITAKIEVANIRLAAFALDMANPDKGPLYAFNWSGDRAVAEAAHLEVWQIVQKALNVPEDPAGENVAGVARNLLLRSQAHAMKPPVRSTSPMASLIGDETRVAWAQVHELLELHL